MNIQVNIPIISLVIPFYNSELFIKDCLASVFSQIESSCEVILVNDGSEDNSVEIVKKNFGKYIENGQCVLVHIANSGPGEARNVGIRAARGKYIGFLDSDDLLLANYFKENLRIIKNYRPQIIQFHCIRLHLRLQRKTLTHIHRIPKGMYELKDVRNDIFGIGKWFPSTRVFLKELLEQNPFPKERIFYEDLITLPFIFMRNASIFLLDIPLVLYRDNAFGTTHNHHVTHFETLKAFWFRILQLPKSLATDALAVQVARTIIYFIVELRLKNVSIFPIVEVIRNIQTKRELSNFLGKGDNLFLQFPLAYVYGEHVRHTLKRSWNHYILPLVRPRDIK